MTKITKDTIQQVASLCRIHCSDDEIEALEKDLSKIVEYIDLLSTIDTDGVEPCNHVLEEVVNVMREDEIKEPLDRDAFLSIAPDKVAGMIRVPPVIRRNPS